MILSLLFQLFFAPGGAWSWETIPSWLLLAHSGSATAWMPLGDIFSNAALIPFVAFVVGMIVFAAALAAWKQLTGQDRKKADIRIESDFVTHEELERRLGGLANELERKFEAALHEEFKQLNQERSRSIAGLHSKVEATATDLRAEISVVNALVREMRGEMKSFFRARGGHDE